jgi:hypothetical protein
VIEKENCENIRGNLFLKIVKRFIEKNLKCGNNLEIKKKYDRKLKKMLK